MHLIKHVFNEGLSLGGHLGADIVLPCQGSVSHLNIRSPWMTFVGVLSSNELFEDRAPADVIHEMNFSYLGHQDLILSPLR